MKILWENIFLVIIFSAYLVKKIHYIFAVDDLLIIYTVTIEKNLITITKKLWVIKYKILSYLII